MGALFSVYEPATASSGWQAGSPNDTLAQMPNSIAGGGASGPPGVQGGPGSFKRLGQGTVRGLAARGQNAVQAISGGSGSAQSSSALDTVLARAAFGSQPYLAKDGGPAQDQSAGQPGNAWAISNTKNEGGMEGDERGTYPFTTSANPHTKDQVADNSLALSHAPQPGQTYLARNHGYDTVAGQEDPSANRQMYLEKDGGMTVDMSPSQKLAWRLAQPDPTKTQEYPAPMYIGQGFGKL